MPLTVSQREEAGRIRTAIDGRLNALCRVRDRVSGMDADHDIVDEATGTAVLDRHRQMAVDEARAIVTELAR